MDWLDYFYIWARRDKVKRLFTRDIGIPRRIAEDEVDLIEYISEQNRIDCYSAVFANWQITNREFDVMLIDVDEHNGSSLSLFNVWCKLKAVLRTIGKYEHVIWFTGRGFHIYLSMPITNLELYGDVCRAWLIDKFKGLGLNVKNVVDLRVTGDMRRVARLPITKNSKVGLQCVPITGREWIWEIVRNAKEGKAIDVEYGEDERLANELLAKQEQLLSASNNYVEWKSKQAIRDGVLRYFEEYKRLSDMPLCIRLGVQKLFEIGELDHYWRLHIAIFLLKVWKYEDVKRLFEIGANDYNEYKTEYQLRYILRRQLYCYGCKKLKVMGICPYNNLRECPFYVLSNGWLENMVGRWREENGKAN